MQDSKEKSLFSGTLTQLFAAVSGNYDFYCFFSVRVSMCVKCLSFNWQLRLEGHDHHSYMFH